MTVKMMNYRQLTIPRTAYPPCMEIRVYQGRQMLLAFSIDP